MIEIVHNVFGTSDECISNAEKKSPFMSIKFDITLHVCQELHICQRRWCRLCCDVNSRVCGGSPGDNPLHIQNITLIYFLCLATHIHEPKLMPKLCGWKKMKQIMMVPLCKDSNALIYNHNLFKLNKFLIIWRNYTCYSNWLNLVCIKNHFANLMV